MMEEHERTHCIDLLTNASEDIFLHDTTHLVIYCQFKDSKENEEKTYTDRKKP